MKWEEVRKLSELKRGDIIRQKVGNVNSLVITDNVGDGAIAVRTIFVSNPQEWLVLRQSP